MRTMNQNSPRRRVVITGMGAVSPNGIGVEAFAQAGRTGKSGLSFIKNVDLAGIKSTVAGSVDDFEPGSSGISQVELRRVPRVVPLAVAASREALATAELVIDPDDIEMQRQIGVSLGTGGGGLAFVEEQYKQFFCDGKPSLFSIVGGTHGNLGSELSIHLHLRGPSHVLSTGCASATDAIAHGRMLIECGAATMMLAGGADAPISRGILAGFEKMRVIATRRWDCPAQASRPFSADRDGFILGEGAWMFVLEEREHALTRHAPIWGELLGYASTCDAFHRVQIAPDTLEPARAMREALIDAKVQPERIDYVNLHGTGTDLNDKLETAAVKCVFGTRAPRIPMSATKSLIGHPQGACGAAGLAATLLMMRDGVIHPTINLDHPDPQCDLDYVANEARPGRIDFALCNCIAFGSKNSAMVIGRGDER